MILARFGYEAFYVKSGKGIYTISDLSIEYGKTLETQGTTGYKPISYITALELIKTGFKIHLDQRFVDVDTKIDAWREMAENRKLYVFSVGGVLVSQNKFVVQSVKVSNIRINGRGKKLSADLDISIQEYAGDQSNSEIGVLRRRLADYGEPVEN
jgi:hypothetical protein